jgi:hypothetical protein
MLSMNYGQVKKSRAIRRLTINHVQIGVGDAVVCRGNFPMDVFFGGDDGAVWNGQVVLEGPTSAQGDVVLVVLDDSVCVFLAMNGSDLPLATPRHQHSS